MSQDKHCGYEAIISDRENRWINVVLTTVILHLGTSSAGLKFLTLTVGHWTVLCSYIGLCMGPERVLIKTQHFSKCGYIKLRFQCSYIQYLSGFFSIILIKYISKTL